jgi:hypothetical protein
MGKDATTAAEVARLALLMKEGRFHLNGESLRFDDAGRLVSGQDRLLALRSDAAKRIP